MQSRSHFNLFKVNRGVQDVFENVELRKTGEKEVVLSSLSGETTNFKIEATYNANPS